MNKKNKAVRTLLRNSAPSKVVAFIDKMGLPTDEYLCVVMHEVEHKSMGFIADALNVSERTAKELHRSALSKIVNEIE